MILGPQQLSSNWLLPLTTLYAAIFVTGLVGNTCTCFIIVKYPYMKTSTNVYLLNLAVADIMTLICGMPLELYSLWFQYPWQLGSWTCILRTVIAEATDYASILTIVTFSYQQCVAVHRNLKIHSKFKLSRVVRNIAVIWTISFAAAAPYGVFTKVMLEPGVPGSAWCGFPFDDPNRDWETLLFGSTLLFFLAPMSFITLLYARICFVLYRSMYSMLDHRTEGRRARMHSRRIVIRMLIAVVVAFFVCWAPYHAQRLFFLYVSLYREWTEPLRKMNQGLFLLAGCFYYFHSTVNPFLYNAMSHRFRVVFRENFCAHAPIVFCCQPDQNRREQANSSSVSLSHQTYHAAEHLALNTPTCVQASLGSNLREKNQRRGDTRVSGTSLSRAEFVNKMCKPHFNSHPNISMQLEVMCVYFSPRGNSNYELARQPDVDEGVAKEDRHGCLRYVLPKGKKSSFNEIAKNKVMLMRNPGSFLNEESEL